jgi:hypothetical protein
LSFGAGNVELVVKVLDADIQTGAVRIYQNSQGTAFAPLQDTRAFSSCP